MRSLCLGVVFMTRTSTESSARPAVAARVLAGGGRPLLGLWRQWRRRWRELGPPPRGGRRPRRRRRRRRARLRSNRPRRWRRGPGLEVVILGEVAEGLLVGAVLAALVSAALAASHDGSGPFV